MISRMFVALCEVPALKKTIWRALYDFLAKVRRTDDWTFMNYGYAAREGNTVELEPLDEPDRYCIQLYHHIASAVNLERRSVVEVGSGRGGGASFVKRYLRPAQMTGLDLSKNAVARCRSRHAVDGLEFRIGDAENLPFADASVDAVINVESSHCYPSFEKFVREVHRVLRPSGHFLYADFRDAATLPAWRKSLQESGFSLVRETDITSNVLLALDRDNERKRALIDGIVPSALRRAFDDFAGMKGTILYEGFRGRRMVYMSFVLQK